MSHTDKTRPTDIQILDPENRGWLQEEHNHTNGICDLRYRRAYLEFAGRKWRGFRFTPRTHCQWGESSLAWNSGLFPRPPKTGWSRHFKREGRARARLRAQVHDWLKWTDWEDVDENRYRPTQSQLWHKWD